MKISNSKKELAKIVSENGGYQSGNFCAQQDDGEVWFSKEKPTWKKGRGVFAMDYENHITIGNLISNRHQAILSRTEYFHLYPAPDADGWIEWDGGECPVDGGELVVCKVRSGKEWRDGKAIMAKVLRWYHTGGIADIIAYRLHKPEQQKPEYCESVTRSIPEPESKQTIEQLAADYRNKLDYADQKQDEADKAKAESGAALSELEKAIAAIGFAITPIDVVAQEPELVITDWRDLKVGDVIFVGGYDLYEAGEGEVINMEHPDYDYEYAVEVMTSGGDERWIDVNGMWSFVRRPAK